MAKQWKTPHEFIEKCKEHLEQWYQILLKGLTTEEWLAENEVMLFSAWQEGKKPWNFLLELSPLIPEPIVVTPLTIRERVFMAIECEFGFSELSLRSKRTSQALRDMRMIAAAVFYNREISFNKKHVGILLGGRHEDTIGDYLETHLRRMNYDSVYEANYNRINDRV